MAALFWTALTCSLIAEQGPELRVESLPEALKTDAAEDSDAAAEIRDGSPVQAQAERTELNLLGEVDSESGETRRNENVRLTLIDNNVLKEINTRMGTTATVLTEFRVDQGYFGRQYGGDPDTALHLAPSDVLGFHGELYATHSNSVFNARSFFQVGAVKPARSNDYGFSAGLPLWRGATVSINGSQRRLRGQVNGNVLVPAADERTPLANDPEDRKIVEQILSAYPAELPNRTDINPRALNTNDRQNIDDDRVGMIFDQGLGAMDRLGLDYGFTLQNVEAFQLVGGQNPDTTTRNHVARMTWTRSWSSATTTDFSVGFERISSLLVPEETSLGPYYLFSRELDSIGPGGDIPIDRAQNMFRYAGRFRQVRGHHTLTAGFDLMRRQINGFESDDHRGSFSFRRDFIDDETGLTRDTVMNLRLGTPSSYQLAIGDVYRGFRDWTMQFYAGDDWRVTPNLTLSAGLQYRPVTAPSVVNKLSEIPYSSDWSNLGPQFGLAYRPPGNRGAFRASYGIHYSGVFPATYMQARFNPPGNILLSIQAPKLSDPLRGLDESDFDTNARSSVYQLAPDLRTPYAHIYSFSWEMELRSRWKLELAYVGSRSHKLLTMWFLNRARPVEGVPQNSETVNDRRPDQRYYTVHHIHNGSRGYFDAAKVTLQIPTWRGFSIDGSYWISKAIDLGTNYTNTASGRDGRMGRGPSEFEFQEEMKGLSDFDQPHAALWRVSYETPALAGSSAWVRAAFDNWQFSSVMLAKSGTPFSISSTDSPGWGNVDGEGGDNPVLIDTAILGRSIDDPDSSVALLPREAFGTIRPTDPRGNLGRNTFRKDGIANVNFSIAKRWNLSLEKSLMLRAESLNFLNHPQFAEPDSRLSSLTFGGITNTLNDGRSFLFTLQFAF